MTPRQLTILASALLPTAASADPTLTSWFTENSTRYARVYESSEDQAALNSVTTWELGQGVQDIPVYADVQAVSYSDDWVYVLGSGLSSHLMGPWYFDEADTQIFANFPSNLNQLYRIPRNPVEETGTKSESVGGINGLYVNGVSLYDMTDTFSYDTSAGYDELTPDRSDYDGNGTSITVSGDDIWNRDAFTNEAVTFDPTNTHQAGNAYHYHANPLGIRHQLGDSVDYDFSQNSYSENFNGSHSPILAFAADGFPVYGPYGYSDPTDASSEVRRMVSGFQNRDGSNGSTDLAVTGRTSLPVWAQNLQGITTLSSSQYGPNVDALINYNVYEDSFEVAILGRYLEDYAYKGDLTGLSLYESQDINGTFNEASHYDLNLYNVRFCVTPDYPEGTYAYFITNNEEGTPVYPYVIGRQLFGVVTAEVVTEISEEVTVQFSGVADFEENLAEIEAESDTVTIVWNAVEGGTYTVESSLTLDDDWTDESTTATPDENNLTFTDPNTINTDDKKFYRITRTALAETDTVDGAGSGDTGGPGDGGGGPPGGGPGGPR